VQVALAVVVSPVVVWVFTLAAMKGRLGSIWDTILLPKYLAKQRRFEIWLR
jgi:hypothetical protein